MHHFTDTKLRLQPWAHATYHGASFTHAKSLGNPGRNFDSPYRTSFLATLHDDITAPYTSLSWKSEASTAGLTSDIERVYISFVIYPALFDRRPAALVSFHYRREYQRESEQQGSTVAPWVCFPRNRESNWIESYCLLVLIGAVSFAKPLVICEQGRGRRDSCRETIASDLTLVALFHDFFFFDRSVGRFLL